MCTRDNVITHARVKIARASTLERSFNGTAICRSRECKSIVKTLSYFPGENALYGVTVNETYRNFIFYKEILG